MIIKNPTQLNAYVQKKSKETQVSEQAILQSYMTERLLERLSYSDYKTKFIPTTEAANSYVSDSIPAIPPELEFIVKGVTLTEESLRKIFREICFVRIRDDVAFEIEDIQKLSGVSSLARFRISLKALYATLRIPMYVYISVKSHGLKK